MCTIKSTGYVMEYIYFFLLEYIGKNKPNATASMLVPFSIDFTLFTYLQSVANNVRK